MEYELNEILTVEEMMELINVGKNTAYLLLERGRLWKIPRKSVYDYIKRKVTSA